ncbi:hypothetical protein H0H87_007039 [Tephrocybe sp. NHM501043]|nr:hypothetical protein H0H87_007039 [Tephrocybe sp. NHM501043]
METPFDCDFDYNYARPKAVVFPAPPPTTNALSRDQRARLVRSSKKIARVLGATPHFVDHDSEGYAKGNDNMFTPTPRSISRGSIDSMDSITSCSTATSHTSASTSATSILSTGSFNRPRKPLPLTPSQDPWSVRKPPMLRLALESSLETIPASPLTPKFISTPASPAKSRTLTTRHRRSAPLDGSPSSSPSNGKDTQPDSPAPSPTAPSFVIPSPAATRRRKMDRLRRTFGEDVPVRLVFAKSSGSDSESGSEPSLTSGSRTSSEDDLTTPNASPLSPTSPLLDVDPSIAEEKPIPRVSQTHSRKKKIINARDSLALPSSPSKSPRASREFVVPQATRPAPPPPTPSPPASPMKKSSSNNMVAQRQSTPASYLKAPGFPHIYEHSPIVHRRSHSGGSTRTRMGLGVILEEKGESEWYGSDDEGDDDYEFVREDEILGAVCGWGNGGAFLYHVPVSKGLGRGLARSYGSGKGSVGGYSRA